MRLVWDFGLSEHKKTSAVISLVFGCAMRYVLLLSPL